MENTSAIATGGRMNMNEKINPQLSSATPCSQEKTKYVLEDVFWVPISNCSSRHFPSPVSPELHSEKAKIGEVSSPGESDSSSASNLWLGFS
jgi:hypothetical protein